MTSSEDAVVSLLQDAAERTLAITNDVKPLALRAARSVFLDSILPEGWDDAVVVRTIDGLPDITHDRNLLVLAGEPGGAADPDDVLESLSQLAVGQRLAVATQSEWAPGATADSRQRMLANADVVLVLEVRGGEGQRPVTLACFERRVADGPRAPSRFMRIPYDEAGSQAVDEVAQLIKRTGGRTPNGYVQRQPLDPTLPVTYEGQDFAKSGGSRHQPQRLASLFSIEFGPISRNGARTSSPGNGPRVLDPSHLQTAELQAIRQRAVTDLPPDALLQPQDICVSTSRARTGPLLVRAIKKSDPPLVADEKLLVLRATVELDERQIGFVARYLGSERTASLLRRRKGVGNYLTISDIADLPIPAPVEALLSALDDLQAARAQLTTWADEVDTATERVLAHDGAQGGIIELRSTGQLLRQRVAAARQLNDRSYRFRSMFPLPVALPYRQAQTAGKDHAGYHQILRCAETFTGYLAMLSIVLARSVGVDLASVKALRTKLANTGHGISMGDWITIVREVSGRKFINRVTRDGPLTELCELASEGSRVSDILRDFGTMRNDLAHNRGPAGAASAAVAFETALSMLGDLYSECEWLCDYPIRLVENVVWDSYSASGTYCYREFVGDHHLVTTRTADAPGPELNVGRLYVVDRGQGLHLLSPLVHWQECDDCGQPAAFFLDRFNASSGSCSLRAMDHSHSIERVDVVLALAQLGLLPKGV